MYCNQCFRFLDLFIDIVEFVLDDWPVIIFLSISKSNYTFEDSIPSTIFLWFYFSNFIFRILLKMVIDNVYINELVT